MKKPVPTDAVLIPDKAKKVFAGEIYEVYQWPQKQFDDSLTTFEMLKRPDTVEVICIVNDKIAILVDEQPHRGSRLSFTGGRVDISDLDVLEAAKRETLEETGYSFNSWRLVNVRQPHTKIEWFIYLFIAWEVNGHIQPHLDAGEKIQVNLLDFNEVKKLVKRKSGYLGEADEVFEHTSDISGLLILPKFTGKTIAR